MFQFIVNHSLASQLLLSSVECKFFCTGHSDTKDLVQWHRGFLEEHCYYVQWPLRKCRGP